MINIKDSNEQINVKNGKIMETYDNNSQNYQKPKQARQLNKIDDK